MDEETIGLVNCGLCDKELLGERAAKFFKTNFTTMPLWVAQPTIARRIWYRRRHMPVCRECLKSGKTIGGVNS